MSIRNHRASEFTNNKRARRELNLDATRHRAGRRLITFYGSFFNVPLRVKRNATRRT